MPASGVVAQEASELVVPLAELGIVVDGVTLGCAEEVVMTMAEVVCCAISAVEVAFAVEVVQEEELELPHPPQGQNIGKVLFERAVVALADATPVAAAALFTVIRMVNPTEPEEP